MSWEDEKFVDTQVGPKAEPHFDDYASRLPPRPQQDTTVEPQAVGRPRAGRRTTNRWEQRGKLSIAVRTTHRLGVADPVGKPEDQETDNVSPSGPSAPLLRIPASKRNRIHVSRPWAPEMDVVETSPRPRRSLPVQMAGRSATAEEDELQRLIREEELLAPLRAPMDILVEALAKLPEIEQERWLGFRNGMVRVLRPRQLLDSEAVKQSIVAMYSMLGMAVEPSDVVTQAEVTDSFDDEPTNPEMDVFLLTQDTTSSQVNSQGAPVQNQRPPIPSDSQGIIVRALTRAERLLETDPQALWNLSAHAMLPVYLTQTGADDRSVIDGLPAGAPLPVPWPTFAAAPMFAETGRWRVERLLGREAAEKRFAERVKKTAARLFPLPLRVTLRGLESAGQHVPDVGDDDAWSLVALRLLRMAAESEDVKLQVLMTRPCEPSGYIALGKRLLKEGLTWMAHQCALVAAMLQPDHAKAQALLQEASDLVGRTASTLSLFETADGVGQIMATSDPAAPFASRWKPLGEAPRSSGLHTLGLPPGVEAALVHAGLSTVAEVRDADAFELIRIPGVGRQGLLWIREALRSKGADQ